MYKVEARTRGEWKEIASGQTIQSAMKVLNNGASFCLDEKGNKIPKTGISYFLEAGYAIMDSKGQFKVKKG